MNREEILDKARKENKGADIVGQEVHCKSSSIAGAGMLTIGAFLNLIGTIKFDHSCALFPVMFCSYAAIQGITKFIIGVRRGSVKLNIPWLLYGLLMTFFTVSMTYFWFRKMKEGAA